MEISTARLAVERLVLVMAVAALAGCGAHDNPTPVVLKEGVRGCASAADAARFEEIERARDWNASMDMLRSGRCIFAAPGETVYVDKVDLDGTTHFREEGKARTLWTRETIKAAN